MRQYNTTVYYIVLSHILFFFNLVCFNKHSLYASIWLLVKYHKVLRILP